MEQCSNFLKEYAQEIARKAAEFVDAEEHEPALNRVMQQLAEQPNSAQPLDMSPLKEAGVNDALVVRLLRAMEAECIELARVHATCVDFCDCVLAFRARIRKSVPRQLPPVPLLEMGQWLSAGRKAILPGAEGQKNSPPEVRALTSFFQSIMDTQREMVYAHDVNGNLFYTNDRGLELVKFTQEDLMDGMSIYDFVVPEYFDLVEARLESPGAVFRSPYTIEIYAKDGERVPVEIETRSMLDEKGDILAVVGVARDLRLERRLQDEIRKTNAQLENVIGNAPIGIILTDKEGLIRDANPAAARLLAAPDVKTLVGMPIKALGEREIALFIDLHSVVEEGKEERQRIHEKTRFGATLNCDVLVFPLRDERNLVDGVLLLLLDVSEEVTLQQSLIHSEKLASLGEVIAGVAHELNNPLTGVLGFAQLLLGSSSDSETRSKLEQIAEGAQRCRRIVECLLSFSRRAETSKSRQSINDMVAETLDLCRYQLRIDDIHVTFDRAPELPLLQIDVREIQQVFLHLLNNAHQALLSIHDHERRLMVKTESNGEFVRCAFSDNGPGIPPDRLSRLFVPFFTTTKLGDRPGLGLSVSYGIVKEHGGDIEVESKPGEGTTFTVVLPVTK